MDGGTFECSYMVINLKQTIEIKRKMCVQSAIKSEITLSAWELRHGTDRISIVMVYWE